VHLLALLYQPGYLMTLSTELANESQQITIRNAAGIALKNALTARVSGIRIGSAIPFSSLTVLCRMSLDSRSIPLDGWLFLPIHGRMSSKRL